MIRVTWGFEHRIPFVPKNALIFVSHVRNADIETARAFDAGARFLVDHLVKALPFGLVWTYREG
ncbi:MAG: hypothetical protein KIS66_13740 [Fimbriimonadaceae bacterium]|nr:hypothetical protein [Fimbriimonadaceae bacterium]